MIILWKTVCGEYSLKQFELKLELASLVSRGIKHLRPYMCLRCWSFVSRLVPKGQDDYSLLKITLRQFLKTMHRILPSCPCLMPLITQLELKPQLATLGQDKRIGALKMCPKMVDFCLKVGPQRSRWLFPLKITLRQFLKLCLEFFLHALAWCPWSHSLSSSPSSQLWAKIKELGPLTCALRWWIFVSRLVPTIFRFSPKLKLVPYSTSNHVYKLKFDLKTNLQNGGTKVRASTQLSPKKVASLSCTCGFNCSKFIYTSLILQTAMVVIGDKSHPTVSTTMWLPWQPWEKNLINKVDEDELRSSDLYE